MLVIGKNVPKNICGRINRNEIPVDVPAFLEIDAVMSPNPTELSENKAIIKNANKIPTMSLLESKPNNKARTKTIITCSIESIILERMLLVIKSADDIGVVLSLLSTPGLLSPKMIVLPSLL